MMMKYNVKKFIFLFIVVIYGIFFVDIIIEDMVINLINLYGCLKLMIEQILVDFVSVYDMEYVVFCYFNVVGVYEIVEIGECYDFEMYLILIIFQYFFGECENIFVFGLDYDIVDGMCICDYIYVMDLVNVYILVFQVLLDGLKKIVMYNFGNGFGYFVKEVIEMCEKVIGKKVNVVMVDCCVGDLVCLVVFFDKIYVELGWKV